MSVGGQLSRLSSVLYVLPPKFARNYQKFPAQGCFCTSSVTALFWRGCAGSVVRTNAKLRPAWRLVVGQTSATAQSKGSGVNLVLCLVPKVALWMAPRGESVASGAETRGDGVVDHFVNRTNSLTGVDLSLHLFSAGNCTRCSFFLERILVSYTSLIPEECKWAVEVRLFWWGLYKLFYNIFSTVLSPILHRK